MKKNILILTFVFISLLSQAQRNVFVFIQSPSNAGYNQYDEAKYGLISWLNFDKNFEPIGDDVWHLTSGDAYITILKPEWTQGTKIFIDKVRGGAQASQNHRDSTLYVYVGHNVLLDRTYDPVSPKHACYDNMLFGCYTINWEGVVNNTLINTTSLIAPEAYTVLPAIIGWVENKSEEDIRNDAAWGYSLYQDRTNYKEARKLFNIKEKR